MSNLLDNLWNYESYNPDQFETEYRSLGNYVMAFKTGLLGEQLTKACLRNLNIGMIKGYSDGLTERMKLPINVSDIVFTYNSEVICLEDH
tara:strand:- start:368 stop:637 length:270 start_codon:yes stop_codon:yes gene_type:complete